MNIKNINIQVKIVSTVLIAFGLFFLDIKTELGIASGINYIFLVLLAFWYTKPNKTLVLAIVSTVLVLLGWHFSPDGGEVLKVILNRFYALIAIWSVATAIFFFLTSKKLLINQKKKFEILSLELRQQLDTLNAAAIVSITDIKGNITFVNDMFCNISKYSEKELLGNNHRMLKSNVHPDGLYVDMWTKISLGRIWSGEICNRAKDGSYYWVAATIAPFINNNGKIDKYVSVRFDITKQKEQELKLKAQSKILENNFKKIEETNKELELFSYSVSHDLKAPLRALQGFSKNLYEKYNQQFDETGLRWLKFIKDNAEKMDELIGDILTFSRINKMQINLNNIDMNKLVEEVIDQEKKGLEIPLKIDLSDLPKANGDYTMLFMVWQNLIGNAIKYSSKQENIKIKISGFENETMNHYTITDNGDGFDMQYYDKLFGVFQRLHGNDEYEGTGIGLANVKRILEKHGGTIKAESEKGKGATFEFTLPKL